ncbi:LysE family translocator [Aeromonas allosaccharophila]|uniref:LysE family translocator n=1 Tax=Aeromonas allosaccharophila TaxID=656 RepID=UPI003D260C17
MMTYPLFAFALVMFAAIITPGPTVLFSLNNAACFSIRHALFGIAGAVIADIVLISLVGLGINALLATSETLFVGLKWLGAAWLAYMGLNMIQSSGHVSHQAIEAVPSGLILCVKGFFLAISNPKYYIFLAAMLPPFIDQNAAPIPQYAALVAITICIDIMVMMCYAILGRFSFSIWNKNGVKWMNRISGAFLVTLAGSILVI